MARRGTPDPSPLDLRASVETVADVGSADWPSQVAELIEKIVGLIRDNTTTKAITVARAIVYAALALIVVPAIITLVLVSAIRILDAYLPSSVFGEDHIWAAYLFLGAPLAIAGWLCVRHARRGAAKLRIAP